MRKVGVEEELLLVDPGTGEMVSISAGVLRSHDDAASAAAASGEPRTEGGRQEELEGELLQHMVEIQTDPVRRPGGRSPTS